MSQSKRSLRWINDALNEVVAEARRALEDYVERGGGAEAIATCCGRLHQLHGVLQVAQLYGAAMLSEEMELVAKGLREKRINDPQEAAEALMLALARLPDYLDKLRDGIADTPLLVLPQLNDLRAVREAPLLTEAALFSPEIENAPLPDTVSGTPNPVMPALAHRVRGHYHKALLDWIRNTDNGALQRLSDVFKVLAEQAHTAPVHNLFAVARVIVIGLQQGQVESGSAVKSVLGKLDVVLRQLMEGGEGSVEVPFARECLVHLLYYIARAPAENVEVARIQQQFGLRGALPSEHELHLGRERLASPGQRLYNSVGSVLETEIDRLKDDLDLFIRSDRTDLYRLEELITPLRKLGDTLGVVGQGSSRARLQRQATVLERIVDGEIPSGDAELMDVASELLFVESALSDLTATESKTTSNLFVLPQGEFLHLVEQTMREAAVEMSRVKGAIEAYAQPGGSAELLEPVATQLHRVAGALRMLDHAAAATLLERAETYVSDRLYGQAGKPPPEDLDALAEAITCIDLYMEDLPHAQAGLSAYLEIARAGLGRLPEAVYPSETDGALDADRESRSLDLVSAVMEPDFERAANEPLLDTLEQAASEPEELSPPPFEPRMAALEEIDPEILDIFLEEAREELENIELLYPRWRKDQSDQDAMVTMRRSFHTLKGSGRLVGAQTIGEFAWGIEHMLNQVIEDRVPVTPGLLKVMDDAVGVLPELVDCQGSGQAPQCDYAAVIERAGRIAKGELIELAEAETAEPVESVEAEHVDEEPAAAFGEVSETRPFITEPEAPIQLDDDLYDVFSRETRKHLGDIREFLDACRRAPADCRFDEGQIRAFHTLKGSARVAEVQPIAEVSRALESFASDMFGAEATVDAGVLDLVEDILSGIEVILGAINVPGALLPNTHAWIARIEVMRAKRVPPEVETQEVAAEPESAIQPEIKAEVESAAEREAESGLADESTEEAESEFAESELAEPELVEDVTVEATVSEPAEQAPPAAPEAPDLDPELVGIFTEEATELFDQIEAGLQRWRRGNRDAGLLDGLQRNLHTLKGGARLAGLIAIGDLSHALESLFSRVSQSHWEGADRALVLAERAADALSAQVQQAAAGDRVSEAETLVSELESYVPGEVESPRGIELDKVARIPAVEAPRPEPEGVAREDTHEVAERAEEVFQAVVPVVQAPGRLWTPPKRVVAAAKVPDERQEQVRVNSALLDRLVNDAGEISIYRARLGQQNTELGYNLDELEQTVARLHSQLRKLDIETEAQILHRFERDGEDRSEFDPLEFDRFSTMQQISRSLMETVNDLVNIKDSLVTLRSEGESMLLQQSRLSNDLQDGLLRTRMVRFSHIVPRLQRLVRQTCSSLKKQADFDVQGADGELDRAILDRMISPLEHILRNALSHGIETPAERQEAGKYDTGSVRLTIGREGSDIVIEVSDDGRGLNLQTIRERAIERGLLDAEARISDQDLVQFVLEPGFSTAKEVTQIAGRGVGMDVVTNEVKQLGGSLQINSEPGKGTRFTIRLPFTLAIAHAMLVKLGEVDYAILHSGIEGVVRVSREHLQACYEGREQGFSYAGRDYKVRYLGQLLGIGEPDLSKRKKWLPMLLVRAGDQRMALQVDGFTGNRQIVVKSVGAQLSTVRWLSGGTILSDGKVALILDVHALIRMSAAQMALTLAPAATAESAPAMTVMVVDDSITVRKVTSRLLSRHGMGVMLAKDGVDAVAQLQEQLPDVVLLDIEMPRMDGYELARHMRSSTRLKNIPIIMITSRVGEKHRQRAMELGVRRYLGKPYQEAELMDNIYAVLAEAKI